MPTAHALDSKARGDLKAFSCCFALRDQVAACLSDLACVLLAGFTSEDEKEVQLAERCHGWMHMLHMSTSGGDYRDAQDQPDMQNLLALTAWPIVNEQVRQCPRRCESGRSLNSVP